MFSLSYYVNLFLLAIPEIDSPQVESDFSVTLIGK